MTSPGMECRPGCAACCVAPSITSPIPGMPDGKPAGVACIQLDEHGLCRLFGHPDRPDVCSSLQAEPQMCGDSREHAIQWLSHVERETSPEPSHPPRTGTASRLIFLPPPVLSE